MHEIIVRALVESIERQVSTTVCNISQYKCLCARAGMHARMLPLRLQLYVFEYTDTSHAPCYSCMLYELVLGMGFSED